MIDRNKHRMSKTEASYKEAMGEKKMGMPKGMGPRKQNVMLAKGGVAKMEQAAVKKPIMRAAGGVAKIRHDAATSAGAPKAAPRSKMGRGI